jgi:hypothetical protein
MDGSITLGSADFVAAMKGTVVSSYPPGERGETDNAGGNVPEDFGRFEELAGKPVPVSKDEIDAEQKG